MDVFSHAGWGYAALRHRGRRAAIHGALAGAAPDLLYFAPYAVGEWRREGPASIVFTGDPEMWELGGPPLPPGLAAAYESTYVYTHSLVLLALAALVVWLARRRSWLWLAVPYAIHILMDIPTHERFAVQPLHPLSDWHFIGLSWGDPRIFWPQLGLLIAALVAVELRARRAPP